MFGDSCHFNNNGTNCIIHFEFGCYFFISTAIKEEEQNVLFRTFKVKKNRYKIYLFKISTY